MPDRPKSAFSRLATYVPNPLASHSSAPPAGAPSSNTTPQPSKASNALEALVSADAGRIRMNSLDGGVTAAPETTRRSSADREGVDSPVYGTPDTATANLWSQRQSLQPGTASYWAADSVPAHPSTYDSAYSFDAPSSSNSSDNYHRSASFVSNRDRLSHSLAGTSIPESGGQAGNDYGARMRHKREVTRALKFTISGVGLGDKGMVGLAKPEDGDPGRVAVAGRTYLKILKIPHTAPPLPSAPAYDRESSYRSTHSTHSTTSASIAYRRSRSRGSLSARSDSQDDIAEKEKEEVTEELDVRTGSKLGPAFLFTDVQWGHGATANKLATSFSNGAVVLWDLTREDPSRVEQLKYEHDRAVNRVVFGGASGSWLMSGGQDGQMKLWDIRESRPASLVLRASSPVRHLRFSPSAAQPFTLLAVCSSGTLVRYDIRLTGRKDGGSTGRIDGHVGAILAMDWRDNLDVDKRDSDRGEGGYVVTGGMDNTIKIWDFSLPTLSSKPVRTLYTSQPVQAVSWHPTRATELISSPLPSLSNVPASTPTGEDGPSEGMMDGGLGSSWRNEIEVWDVRKEFYPKLCIKTIEPISAIIYNEDDTIWSTSKSSATFHQHDVNHDAYSTIETYPRSAASWNVEGDLIFVEESRKINDIPFDEHYSEFRPVDSPAYRPESSIAVVPSFDPDHEHAAFASLANNYVLYDEDLAVVCDHNIEAANFVNRSDAAELFSLIKIWLDDKPLHPPIITPPTLSRSVTPPPLQPDILLSPPRQQATPLQIFSAPTSPNRVLGRRPASNPLSRNRSLNPSPLTFPVELPSLANFPEEANDSSVGSSNLRGPSLIPAEEDDVLPDDSTSSSSMSEQDLALRYKDLTSPKILPLTTTTLPPGPSASKLSTTLAALGRGRARSATNPSPYIPLSSSLFATPTAFDSLPDLDDFNLPQSLQSFSGRHSRLISSSSETDSDAEEEYVTRARAALNVARMKSRRSSSNNLDPLEKRTHPPLTRENLLTSSRRTSDEKERPMLVGIPTKRKGDGAMAMMMSSIATLKPIKPDENSSSKVVECTGPFVGDLRRGADVERVKELTVRMKERIIGIVVEYAEKGDAQLAATVCCILQHRDVAFDPGFVVRVTKAYLDLLRRGRHHVAAAGLLKYCAPETLRTKSQTNVVFHTACGHCGKALEQSPMRRCQRCACQVSTCAICHLIVRRLLVFCPTCGHGAHPTCLSSYSSSLLAQQIPPTSSKLDVSHPSTPGFPPTIRAWMWGETIDAGGGMDSPRGMGIASGEIVSLLECCPTGTCDCRGCILSAGLAI